MEGITLGIQRDLMMYAAMIAMNGFPMLSSGDEIGQLNDYGYHGDPTRREDSRNLHRSAFRWDNDALRIREGTIQEGTVQQRVWDGLRQLEELRVQESAALPQNPQPPLGIPITTMCWPCSVGRRPRQ